MSNILIADDEKSMVEMLGIMFEKENHNIFTAGNTADAIKLMDENDIDLVISDMKIPTGGGMEILRASLQRERIRPVIMITAYASAESAVEAMKIGACDYIMKPFNVEELKIIVEKALERRNLILENQNLKSQLRQTAGFKELIGRSNVIKNIKETISRVAATNSTVLITGESGTGKEIVARSLHDQSNRSDKPFMSINCGALPEHLLESELFGYKKGAFTGAFADKIGLMESANGGTFFLDEVAEMPPLLQIKLLRAIQEKEIRRVGDVKEIKLDVRFVAATNVNIEEVVESGAFREDLYYRLNVINISLAPLRERREDIPILAKHFLDRFNALNDRTIKGFSGEAMKAIERNQWRGNVRELENAVERAVVLESSDIITLESLPENIRQPTFAAVGISIPSEGIDLEEKIGEIEKELIQRTLERVSGSKKEAAILLNMSLRSFRYKLTKYEIK